MMCVYTDNFNGEAGGGSKPIEADKTVSLPDQPCRFVILSNWTVTDATDLDTPRASAFSSQPKDAADGSELYYGFRGQLTGQIFAGESTILLPVNNLKQICVRAAAGKSGVIRYAWFI